MLRVESVSVGLTVAGESTAQFPDHNETWKEEIQYMVNANPIWKTK